ncbi:MAG: hypothetical protein RIE56_04265 [Amphiplicatus sp.]
MSKKLFALQDELRLYALTFPETHGDHPWSHAAIKARKKPSSF